MNTEREHNAARSRLATVEPWASLLGGGALTVYGVTRRSLGGAALAAMGGYLVYHGATAAREPQPVLVERSLTINKPREEVFRFWRNLENLPRFMRHLESVRSTGERWSEWTARSPLGGKITWHAEITQEREGESLVWQSLPGSDLNVHGSVEFRQAPGDRGTELRVTLRYSPAPGKIGEAVATLLRRSPRQQIAEDLRRFKQLMEAGEIPTTEGQPHGRRSAIVSAAQRAYREPQPWRHAMPRTA
ncbi:MAG: SRPBCC family protein [Terriglobales bacterium]